MYENVRGWREKELQGMQRPAADQRRKVLYREAGPSAELCD